MTSQQAITLLRNLEQSLDDYCELNDEGKTAFSKAITALELFGNSEQLPSAQPEIIRCRDCKFSWMTNGGDVKYCDIWFPDEACYIDGDHFCASAERREE